MVQHFHQKLRAVNQYALDVATQQTGSWPTARRDRLEAKELDMNDDQRLAQAEQLLKEARAALRAAKGDGTTVTPRSVGEAIEAIDVYFHHFFPNPTNSPGG
jgi:hypothetical protein